MHKKIILHSIDTGLTKAEKVKQAKTEDGADNKPDEDGAQKLTKTKQMEFPFHLLDRERTVSDHRIFVF